MSESVVDQVAPTNDKAVLGFCELWALFFGLPPGEALYRGEPLTMRMALFMGIASVFAVLGPIWPIVKTRFPRRLSTSFVRAASDFRWWAVVLLALGALGYLAVPTIEPLMRLSKEQRVKLTNIFNEGPDISSKIWIISYTSCEMCGDYAWDFAEVMNGVPRWARKDITPDFRAANLNVRTRGVIIGVPGDQKNDCAIVIASAFDAAKVKYSFSYKWKQAPFNLPPENAILLIMPRR